MYEIDASDEGLHREIAKTKILLSNEHIAWNVESKSLYDTRGVTKSGIRLDYNPLYIEKDGKIDKTKTKWVTSVDISGFHLDKIFNKYSPRGHHFTKLFKYKINLIMPGLAKSLGQFLDRKSQER